MTTSEFRKFQEDPCVEEDEFEIAGGEECRDCTPNPSAFVPDWRYQPVGVPFKNERTCQYCVVLIEDADGRSINSQNINDALDEFDISFEESIPVEEYERSIMARLGNTMSFREEALSIFLEEYGKQDPLEASIEVDSEGFYTGTEGSQGQYDLLFASIGVEEALVSTESTISIGTPFKFLVCIDTESIFWLPNKPEEKDLQTFYSDDSVILDGRKLFAQLNRLSYTLGTFGRYASTSDMTVRKFGEKTSYTVSDYGNSGEKNIFDFYHELNDFLRANDYSIGVGRVARYDLAEEIKIVFDPSDSNKPFVIDKIYAKKKYCEFEELKKSKSKLKQGTFVDQTLMGYISKIPDIDVKLTSPQPVTWVDFLLDYTFPQLEIIMDGQLVTELEDDPVGMFYEKELNKTVNLVTTAMTKGISETFNEWSKRNCEMSRGQGGDPRDDRELASFQNMLSEVERYAMADDSFISIFKQSSEVNWTSDWPKKILTALGICGKSAILEKAVRCLLREMSFNEFLKAQTKVYMKNLQPYMIQELAKSLPFSVAEEITTNYINDLAGAPLPWETSYDNGIRYDEEQVTKLYQLRESLGLVEEIGAKHERKLELQENAKTADAEVEELRKQSIEIDEYYKEQLAVVEEQLREQEAERREEESKRTQQEAADRFTECKRILNQQHRDGLLADGQYEQIEADCNKILADGAQKAEDERYVPEDWTPDSSAVKEAAEEATREQYGVTRDNASVNYQARRTRARDEEEELESLQDIPEPPTDVDQLLKDLGYEDDSQMTALEHYERDLGMLDDRKFKKEMKQKEREVLREQMNQATLYRPAPNLQAALTEAYVNVLLEHIGTSDLQRVLDNIPDSYPIGPVFDALKCPWNDMFSPPITRFLGATELNTVFDCKPGHRLKGWEFLPKFDAVNIKDAITKNLWNAFSKSLTNAFVNLLMSLLKQAVDLINEQTCRLLNGVGDAAINGLNGGGPNAFADTLANAFKDKPDFPQNYRDLEKNNMLDKVMDGYGVKPDCPDISEEELSQNYRDLYTAIGYALSVRELKELFGYRIENYDPMVLSRVQQSIAIHADCFKDTFNNQKSVGTFFRDVSSSISPEVKNEIIQSIIEEDSATPVVTSICLSKQQYEDWLNDRINFLLSLGIPEEIANENVAAENANNAKTLETLLDALNNNDDFIKDNIANKLGINDGPLFDDKGNLIDPSCYPKGGLLDTNSEEVAEATDIVSSTYFDTLDMTFVKDLTQGSKGGLLDLFLASTANANYKSHNFKSTFPLLRDARHMGYSDDPDADLDDEDQFYPKTVGMLYHESTVEDVLFNSSLALDAPEPSFLERAATAAAAAVAEQIGVGQVTDLEVETTYPASFTMEFEQNWDNFETKKSKLLQKRTSKTELTLHGKDSTTGFSINKHVVTNYKTWVLNNTGIGPAFSTPLPDSQITIEQDLDPAVTEYIEENYDLSQSYDYPFRSTVFNKKIKKSFEHLGLSIRSDDDDGFYSSSYGKTSELVFNGIKNMCYNTPEGDPNSGFDFGFLPDEELTPENLTYVDPEPGSTEYTKSRRDKILGRAQEPHPRVHFLDPEKHGGSYVRPRLYVEPPRALGWKGLYDAMVPEVDSCAPARTTIINIPAIKKYVSDTKSKIARDPRLNNASDCIKMIPFDLIISQQSRAQIEAAIKTAMRIYISEAYIHTTPVFSSIFGGSLENYDNTLFDIISDEMLEDMSSRYSRFTKKIISRKNYVNTFLEQCVQMYSRLYYSGEITASPAALEALTRLEQSQMRYKYPDVDWLLYYFSQDTIQDQPLPHRELGLDDMPYRISSEMPDDVATSKFEEIRERQSLPDLPYELSEKKSVVNDALLQDFYLNSLIYDDLGERMFLPPPEEGPLAVAVQKPPGPLKSYVKRANKFFRLFTRLFTVRMMKKECSIIFRELMKEEYKYIVTSMANAVEEKAPVFRVMQNFTTKRGLFYGNNTNFGSFDSVLESTVSGDITSVTNNIGENLFDQMELSSEEADSIVTKGAFVIQKYFRVIEKPDNNLPQTEAQNIIASRSIDLFGVVNPESLLEFIESPSIQDPEAEFDEDTLISDVFGSLEFVYGLTGQEYVDGVIIDSTTGLEAAPLPADTPEEDLVVLGTKGEMGLKKGLRLLYVPNEEHYAKLLGDNPDLSSLQQQAELGDYEVTAEALDATGYTGLSREYLLDKAFFMAPYEDKSSLGCAIPLMSVEIDEFDQELINLQNFSDDDYKCLLTKLIETDEFKITFDYCFPVRTFVGANMAHTLKSFYMSLGMGSDERTEYDGFLGIGKPKKPRTGRLEQPDDDVLDALDDTKDLLRTVFANIYSTEDFQKTFEFDSDKDLRNFNEFTSLLKPQLKRFMGHKQVRRPFDKDGNECESPVGKLFGGK